MKLLEKECCFIWRDRRKSVAVTQTVLDIMSSNSSTNSVSAAQFLPAKTAWRWLILLCISALALAVRAYEIDDYPLDSHPIKQYSAALVAREYYYQLTDLAPEWKRDVARVTIQEMGSLTPTILEHIAAYTYLFTGNEQLWIPRLISAISWIVGGAFLYFLAQQLASAEAAIVSTSFYLFLPFAMMISRNFQPDPMMIMMMIVSLFAIIRYHNSLSRKWLLIASITAALAILIKPVSLFILFAGFVALAGNRQGLRGSISDPTFILFYAISLLPSLFFYGSGLFITGSLQGQAQASFLPALLIEPYFWQFWLKHIHATIGFAALVGALLGVLLFSKGWKRNFVIGLWIGYLVYGMVFTYHIHTHDYYQMPFIPIVALSLGPLGALVLDQFMKLYSPRSVQLIVGGILLLAITLSIGLYAREREELPDFGAEIQRGEEIGEVVSHSTRTILLAPYNGIQLRYHGYFHGQYWPTLGEIRVERLIGLPEMNVERRFQMLSQNNQVDYFVITNFDEFKVQEDLKSFLNSNFPVIANNDRFIIFDLRDM